MWSRLRKLSGQTYKPLNRIEISHSALKNNFLYLNSLQKNIKIAPVLKSNAYGHGLTLIAKELEKYYPPLFCLDSLYEAYELLKIKIKTPLLVMGYFHLQSLKTKKLPFSYAVSGKEQALAVNQYQPWAKIHLFADTGMRREGILINELGDFLFFLKTKTNLVIEGLMSHLAKPAQAKGADTRKQIRIFKQAREIINSQNIFPRWTHLLSSGGLLNPCFGKEDLGNLARVGLGLYGIDPSEELWFSFNLSINQAVFSPKEDFFVFIN